MIVLDASLDGLAAGDLAAGRIAMKSDFTTEGVFRTVESGI
jgi:hypothetical protein